MSLLAATGILVATGAACRAASPSPASPTPTGLSAWQPLPPPPPSRPPASPSPSSPAATRAATPAPTRAAPDARRLVVHVFYSGKERAIPAAEAVFLAVRARHPGRVEIVRHDVERPEEYERLRRFERELGVTKGFAEIEAFVAVEGAGEPLEGVALLGLARLAALPFVAARVFDPPPPPVPLPEETLLARAHETFGAAADLVPPEETPGLGAWREVRDGKGGGPGGRRLGFLREVIERSGCIACEDAHFLILAAADGRVRAVVPVRPLEQPLVGITREKTDAFRKGLEGRAPGERLVLGETLDGITGATKTSRLYASAVRRALAELAPALPRPSPSPAPAPTRAPTRAPAATGPAPPAEPTEQPNNRTIKDEG